MEYETIISNISEKELRRIFFVLQWDNNVWIHNKSSERRKKKGTEFTAWNDLRKSRLNTRPCEEKRSTNEVELSTIYFEAIQNSMLMDANPFNSGTCLKFNTQLRFIRNCNILIQYCSNNTFTNETVFMMQHRRDNSRNISLPWHTSLTSVCEPLSM